MDTGRVDPRVGSGQKANLAGRVRPGRYILNALCEFFNFYGFPDRNCNEKVLH